ncbi:MAG: winged helix-turn-helix transcriptional regulator [Clostridia bacterium]|nr:winged helix-turn-helix transcriptional regulator [Clostridia bacterium]MBN2882536.1 winged helix-turn-helix transcriptional regulator [Clostridia bacterium]
MKINLNTRVAMLADFMFVMGSAIQGKTCYENGLPGIEPSKKVCEVFESIINDYNWEIPGLKLLFMPYDDRGGYVPDVFKGRMYAIGTVGNLINQVLADPHVLIATLYEYFSGKSIHPETMTGMELRSRISKLSIPSDIKEEFLAYSRRPMGIANGLKKFMNRIRRRIKNAYADNVDVIRNASKVVGINLRHEGANFLKLPLSSLPEENREISTRTSVTITFLNEFAVNKIDQDDSTLIVLGYRYKEALDAIGVDSSRANMERFLKAFSEENRITMIRMITESPRFVGELAEITNLAISTTSYHLDMLMAAGILDHKVEEKKAFYTMRSDYVADMFMKISEVFRSKTF